MCRLGFLNVCPILLVEHKCHDVAADCHFVCLYRTHVFDRSICTVWDRGSTVVKVLRYKSEGRLFDPRWCHWNFFLTYSFRSHYGPGVDSASDRNEYQEYFLGVKLASA